MTSDPEESVGLQGYGEMTLRTAIATLMAVPARDRADAVVFRVRDGSRLASREIAELASDWGIAPTGEIKSGELRSPARDPDRHWREIIRGMVPSMVKAGWGRIINVASNAGVSGYGYSSAYCAAKHAMVGMTRALAIDLARTGVTINALCPGWVETQMADEAVTRIAQKTGRSLDEARTSLAQMSPQRRMISPEEVAHAALMLCSHDARGIHGQTIVIDGGAIMK